MNRRRFALSHHICAAGEAESLYAKLRRMQVLPRPAILAGVRTAKRARRKTYERTGSDRYSQPSLGHLEPTLAE